MKYLKYVGIAIAVIIVALAVYKTIPAAPSPVKGISAANGTLHTQNVSTDVISLGVGCGDASLAALNGCNDVISVRQALVSATTTPCAILSPSATSTLQGFSVLFNPGTTTAAYLQIATSTTAFASTSPFATFTAFASASLPNVLTWEGSVNNTLILPSTYVMVKEYAITATGGFVQSGICTATFQTIN